MKCWLWEARDTERKMLRSDVIQEGLREMNGKLSAVAEEYSAGDLPLLILATRAVLRSLERLAGPDGLAVAEHIGQNFAVIDMSVTARAKTKGETE